MVKGLFLTEDFALHRYLKFVLPVTLSLVLSFTFGLARAAMGDKALLDPHSQHSVGIVPHNKKSGGLIEPFILGTDPEANPDAYVSSTVALYITRSPNSSAVANFCTGTLIGPSVILTAAHCLVDVPHQYLSMSQEEFKSQLLIGFGKHLAKSYKDKRVKFIKVSKAILHPHYHEGLIPKALTIPIPDIALLLLETPAPPSYYPVKLGTNPTLVREGREMILAGFGLISEDWAILPNQLSQVKVTIDNPHLTSTQFSYRVENGNSACFGDSGGPAFFETESGEFVVGGVTSWGDDHCSTMGAYTSVPAFKDFLTVSLKQLNQEIQTSSRSIY